MSYLTTRNGGIYWFQIRVPKALVTTYGTMIRQCLQTRDISVAQPLALRLASYWMERFAAIPGVTSGRLPNGLESLATAFRYERKVASLVFPGADIVRARQYSARSMDSQPLMVTGDVARPEISGWGGTYRL